jgi:hypothetical protein
MKIVAIVENSTIVDPLNFSPKRKSAHTTITNPYTAAGVTRKVLVA